MTKRAIKAPEIPVMPGSNSLIIERIKVKSLIAKKYEAKESKVKLTEEQIANETNQVLNKEKDLSKGFDEHPHQGVIVAINDELQQKIDYRVGDKIAFRISESIGSALVYKKKLYISLFDHDILFRYLTKEV